MSRVMFVRDGKKVWPYCSDCSCRLEVTPLEEKSQILYAHYGTFEGKDARGHRCKSADTMFVSRFSKKIMDSVNEQI